jgi:pyridoxine/pyridoxamine 5'-phosphate oxidase
MTVSAKIEPQIATLDEIRDYVWNALERAAHNRHDAFHTAMTGTISEFGCQMRTVILRKVDRHSGTLFFHTDYRSVKIRELEKDHRLSWLFYDADRKVQIRAASTAAVHYQDAVARERWQASSLSSRRCYLAPSAPGQFTTQSHYSRERIRLAEFLCGCSSRKFPGLAVSAFQRTSTRTIRFGQW